MDDLTKVPHLLLESAATLAHAIDAAAIIVAVDALPPLDAVPSRTILASRTDADELRAAGLAESAKARISVPNVELD